MKDREAITTNGRAAFYAAIWNDLRQAALNKGWALALHGSLASDMDIMAMPWTEEASEVDEMIEGIKNCFTDSDLMDIQITDKPNNRRVYTLSIWADFYLDINIINEKKYHPLPWTHLLHTIELIRDSFDDSVKVYTQGSCVKFAMILKQIYPEGVILWEPDHTIFKYENNYFDINGVGAVLTPLHQPIEDCGLLQAYRSMSLKYNKTLI